MNNARAQRIEEGLTAIARKVLQFVPVSEAWEVKAIVAEMHRTTQATIDRRVVDGCLRSLVESGIVREVPRGFFQRLSFAREIFDKQFRVSEETMSKPNVDLHVKANDAEAIKEISPLARLSRSITSIRSLASDLLKKCDELEEAALAMDHQLDGEREKTAQIDQLRKILKAIGE